jgi:hypothetical protein
MNREQIKAVEQILPEGVRLDGALQVAIGRRHHSHIDSNRCSAADPLESARILAGTRLLEPTITTPVLGRTASPCKVGQV